MKEKISKRVLHEWPLSKVELIELNGKKYILKTIHKDFKNEAFKQKILYKHLKNIGIPKVYWIKKEKGKIVFLMEYIAKKEKINDAKALELIDKFHKATVNLKNKYFKKYNFNTFFQDFLQIKKYLPKELSKMNKTELKDVFTEVFSSSYSIVHGDWGRDQILGRNNKYYIVDFGKAFYGPSILDYANFFGKNKIEKLNGMNLIKARLVMYIIELSWWDLCKRKYIKYAYKKEIAETQKKIKYWLKKLK